MQQALKPASGAAWTQIVAAELLGQLDIAMNEPPSTLDVGFGWEGLPPLTRDAESRGGFRNRDACAWHTSLGSRRGPLPRGVPTTRFAVLEAGRPEWPPANHPILATPTASTESVITSITSCSDTVGWARHCESFSANDNLASKNSGS